MDKKKVFGNTVLFICIVSFVGIFGYIFGDDNNLVGVASITIALSLLPRDLTVHPLENLAKLISVNLFLGLLSQLSIMNVWLGLVLNALALFTIGYCFSYDMRSSEVLPFGLLYLFMLYSPVEAGGAVTRGLALITGAAVAMLLQMLFNRKKLQSVRDKVIPSLRKNIALKLELLSDGKDVSTVSSNIAGEIAAIKKTIYDRRVKKFYLTEECKALTDIVWSLEKIDLILDRVGSSECDFFSSEIPDALDSVLKDIGLDSSSEAANSLCSDLSVCENSYSQELSDAVSMLSESYSRLSEISREANSSSSSVDDDSASRLKVFKDYIRSYRLDSYRFSYSLRLAVTVSLAAFFTQHFELSEGRWMVFTVFSLIQPYAEDCRVKARKRVEGTAIGLFIVFAVFSFVEDPNLRLLSLLVAGYLNPFFSDYRNIAILLTISAVASAGLTGNISYYVLSRLGFVLLGTAIALMANRYLLPYTLDRGRSSLANIYSDVVAQALSRVRVAKCEHSVKSLFLAQPFIDEKMKSIEFGCSSDDEKQFVSDQKTIVNDIYKEQLELE